jgi:malate dehydrogenase (oxaloacetate-decarboxylating)(NADP+)
MKMLPLLRKDVIMATGRSDFPNQVNNVLGFPYIFRGALDVRATTINEEMKLAAVRGFGRTWQKHQYPILLTLAYNCKKVYLLEQNILFQNQWTQD